MHLRRRIGTRLAVATVSSKCISNLLIGLRICIHIHWTIILSTVNCVQLIVSPIDRYTFRVYLVKRTITVHRVYRSVRCVHRFTCRIEMNSEVEFIVIAFFKVTFSFHCINCASASCVLSQLRVRERVQERERERGEGGGEMSNCRRKREEQSAA